MLSVAESAMATTSCPGERFDDLFRRFYPRLVPLAERLLGDRAEGEDIVQEAFLRLARSGQDDGPLVDRPDEVVGAWLRRVVLNLGVNRLRDRRRADDRLTRAGRLDAALDPERSPSDDDNPPQALLRAEARDEVRAALAASAGAPASLPAAPSRRPLVHRDRRHARDRGRIGWRAAGAGRASVPCRLPGHPD